jgi:diguanylate cyclase (GGDEF)-like protein
MQPDVLAAEERARAATRGRMVWLLTLALAAAAAALIVPQFVNDDLTTVPLLPALALLPAFALAEVVVIHLPTQRNAHGHTLREIPAVVGLTFLTPQAYVVVYVVGAAAALLLWVRMRGVKLAFNTALFAFEAGLGVLTYTLVLHGEESIGPIYWLAALTAVLVTDLISAAAVTAAISITEGNIDGEVMREALRWGVPAACINTSVALLVTTLINLQPSALALLVVIVVLLLLGYRVYIGLARGHARTQLLYRFVERTGAAQSLDDVIRVVLSEAAELMSADSAHLLEPVPGSSRFRCQTLVGDEVATVDVPLAPGQRPWWQDAAEGRSVLVAARRAKQDEDERDAEGRAGDTHALDRMSVPLHPRDALAAPLRAQGRVRAVLVACDRAFQEETFGHEDLQVFETLAANAAVALERADTVHRLERVAEERAYDALHDPLSGLPNRRAFNEAVTGALKGAVDPDGVLLLLDLDDFKDVNDTLGHSAGDRLIVVSGARLRDQADGLVARLGGDEFAVLLPGRSVDDGLAHARRLREVVSQPVPLDDVQLTVSASIGVAAFGAIPTTADELLAQADVAMYTAKADRSGVAAYRPEVGDSTARRLALAADLPQALDEGHLRLWFQPQAEAETSTVTGFEALVRWQHPAFGMVPPPEIVAVAVRTGRIRQLTDDLLRQALDARRRWYDAGHDLAVSVNITAGDIADHALVGRVQQELDRTSTPAAALVLEVTESDPMKDPERSVEVLAELSEMGVTVSIDDFGTGYSSLAYLDRLPVGEVKIDQSFVFRLERGAADGTIVSATVALAHDLGLRVVAEGVESALARRVLQDLGVDLYQGYGLARPMPEPDVLPWLGRHADLLAEAPPGVVSDLGTMRTA